MQWRLTNLNDSDDPHRDEWALLIDGETVFTSPDRAAAKAELTRIVGPASDTTPIKWSVPRGGPKDPWDWTADEIYAAMPDDKWCLFGVYDNIGAVRSLVGRGLIEPDLTANNCLSGMSISLTMRKVMQKAPPTE